MLMLDIRTMFAMLVLSCFLSGIGVLALQVPEERRDSARRWGAGNFLMATGLVLIALRDIIPFWLSVVPANTLVFAGLLLDYQALRLLLGKPFSAPRHLAAITIYFLTIHTMVAIGTSDRYRICFVSIALMSVLLIALRTVWQTANIHTRGAQTLMRFFYGTAVAAALVRAIHSGFFMAASSALFETNTIQVLNFVAYFFGLIGAGVAYVMLQSGMTYNDLAVIASNDPLTGLRNRRNFMDMAERDWALSQRMWRPLSVMMLDMDNVKSINAEFGHATGDEALRRAGEVMRRTLRDVDLAGRYGGEEFCALLADTSTEVTRQNAERIREGIAAIHLEVGGKRVALTASIGISGMMPGEKMSLQQLLSAADSAVRQAKAAGRNCVRIAGQQ